MKSLELKNIAQIKEAKLSFGDLTILVGNQATGKSIFLQMCKLIEDIGFIKSELNNFGFSYDSFESFLSLFFGEGMESIYRSDSSISVDGMEIDLKDRLNKARNSEVKHFYIPAQRVLIMEHGFAKPFASFDIAYPYVLKEFSELIRLELDKAFLNKTDIFPQPNKLREELRDIISRHIYRNSTIKIKTIGNKKQLILEIDNKSYAVGSWSAGQKEFAPLLFGIYWALPPSRVSKRDKISTITIEEPEMGLHPNAIVDCMFLVLELLNRGYRVNISTHSNTILELFWAINKIKQLKDEERVSIFGELFNIKQPSRLKEFAINVLNKKIKIYYFKNTDNQTTAIDISHLDVTSANCDESEWGEITSFSSRVSDIVSKIYGKISAK